MGELATSTTTMPAIDPSDQEAVQRALRAYLHETQGLPSVAFAEAPSPIGRGFDTYIYSFRLGGDGASPPWSEPLILRLYRTAAEREKAASDAAVQRFAAGVGFPTPTVLASEPPENPAGLPFVIMERVQGRAMLDCITANPLAARRLLREMAGLHVTLHNLPVGGWPLRHEQPMVEKQIDQMRTRIARGGFHELAGGLDWLENRKSAVIREQAVLCHGDFHPLNLMVEDSGRVVALDWSDAALGDRHHDVARTVTLFAFAYIAAESTLERFVLRSIKGLLRSWYLGPYQRALPLERGRFLYWEALHALRGLLQLHELDLDRPDSLGSNPEGIRRLPSGLRGDVRQYFERKRRQFEGYSRTHADHA